jgi:NADP-dependent 3-hydroxy acid dehydrogenase YdfG
VSDLSGKVVAGAVVSAISQPQNVGVGELLVRPSARAM